MYYYRGHAVVGHDGTISGFASRFFFMRSMNFGAVIMGNSSSAASVTGIIGRELIDAVLGVPEEERWHHKHHRRSEPVPDQLPVHVKPTGKSDRKKGEHGAKTKDDERTGEREGGKEQGKQRDVVGRSHQEVTSRSAYTGKYWHPGYHNVAVQIKDGKLLIDATDRSMGFALSFDHVRDQTKYIGHLCDMYDGEDDSIETKFVFQKDKATKLGLRLEVAIQEMIWFERVEPM